MRWLLAFVVLVAGATTAVAQEKLVAVPFVGCAADGMMGLEDAPESGTAPSLPAPVAARLAYYSNGDFGILAPRDWQCFEIYGSGGYQLYVMPKFDSDDLFAAAKLKGPFVELEIIRGGTSGRFPVAQISGPLFPIAKPFVQKVAHEIPKPHLTFVRFPYDRLTRRSDTVAEFTTPAYTDGLGNYDRFARDGRPIDGVAILLPEEFMNLVIVRARLPAASRDLAPAIVRQKIEMARRCACASDKFD